MTEIFIKPRLSTKEASFKGTVAAGEQVSVKIANPSDAFDLIGLRLRVIGNCGETLAQFPEPVEEGETPDSWGEEGGNVTCVLDLCTDKMLAAVPPRATVEFLFVLDDAEGGVLYFKDLCPITHWPMRTGEDVPKNVRDYRDFIAEANETIVEAQNAAREALAAAEGYVADGNGILVQAQNKLNATLAASASAVDAKNNAEAAVEDARAEKTAAENAAEAAQAAQAAAESAKENIETPTTNLTLSGKAADAKTVGDRFAELEGDISAKADTSSLQGLATQASVENEASLRSSADAAMAQDISSLSTGKADKSDTYTKSQVDAIVDAVKNGRFIAVDSLPAVANADKNAIYLVPNTLSQTNNVKDEYIVVGNSWEKIGNTQIELSDLVKSVNGHDPDSAGNVQLSPADIGALPSTLDGVSGYVMAFGGAQYALQTPYTQSDIDGWGTSDGAWKLFVAADGTVLLLKDGAPKPTNPLSVAGIPLPWSLQFNDGGLVTAVFASAGTTSTEEIIGHLRSKDNPHGVTAAQVGLGNVDNTSDTSKPISTAAQNALNAKLGKSGANLVTTSFNIQYNGEFGLTDILSFNNETGWVINANALNAVYADEAGASKELINPAANVKLILSQIGKLFLVSHNGDVVDEVAKVSGLSYAAVASGNLDGRQVLEVKLASNASTTPSFVLPAVSPSDDKTINFDIVIDAMACTADPTLDLSVTAGSENKLIFAGDNLPTIKHGEITVLDFTSLPKHGQHGAWMLMSAGQFKEHS